MESLSNHHLQFHIPESDWPKVSISFPFGWHSRGDQLTKENLTWGPSTRSVALLAWAWSEVTHYGRSQSRVDHLTPWLEKKREREKGLGSPDTSGRHISVIEGLLTRVTSQRPHHLPKALFCGPLGDIQDPDYSTNSLSVCVRCAGGDRHFLNPSSMSTAVCFWPMLHCSGGG